MHGVIFNLHHTLSYLLLLLNLAGRDVILMEIELSCVQQNKEHYPLSSVVHL